MTLRIALHLGLLLVLLLVGLVASSSPSSAICDAEGECRAAEDFEHKIARPEDEQQDTHREDQADHERLKNAVVALMKWVTAGTQDDVDLHALLAAWAAPEVVVEAEATPNVPWRGRYEGVGNAAAFFVRLRRGLYASAEPTANATLSDGLQWSAAAGAGTEVGLVVRWEPPTSTASEAAAQCGAWLMAWADGSGRLARLAVHHTRSLACAAAYRTRAQRAFDGAFAHFFRMDYAAFRTSFSPDLVLTWHADPPVGKEFHGNGEEGLMKYIHTRVQIFLQTSVEFDPIVADEASASYYVVFRPLTIRATGQVFGEVRGLLVIHIDEAGLIDQYHMTVLDHRVNAALAHSVHD